MDEVMEGGRFSRPIRRGDRVERGSDAGNPNVHALLRHFQETGFALTPRYLGSSGDGKREILSYIEGETAHYPLSATQRTDETLVNVARAIRQLHDATQGFVPVEPDNWRGYDAVVPARIDCIGHHDLAPWNIVFDGSRVVGIIDWDGARPSNRAWDLAYAACRYVPLTPFRWATAFGWTEDPDRAARLRLFVDSYDRGIEPAEILDFAVLRLGSTATHIEQQIRAGNPDFEVHRDEDHANGYRNDIRYILDNRDTLLR